MKTRKAVCIKTSDKQYMCSLKVKLFRIYKYYLLEKEKKYKIFDEIYLNPEKYPTFDHEPASITKEEFNRHFVDIKGDTG